MCFKVKSFRLLDILQEFIVFNINNYLINNYNKYRFFVIDLLN